MEGRLSLSARTDRSRLLKALRWAISSAEQQSEAVLAAFLLPAHASTAYRTYLGHNSNQNLLVASRQLFRTGKTGSRQLKVPKSDMHVFFVANPAGIDKYTAGRDVKGELYSALTKLSDVGDSLDRP